MHIKDRATKVVRLARAIDEEQRGDTSLPTGEALIAAAILIASEEISEQIEVKR